MSGFESSNPVKGGEVTIKKSRQEVKSKEDFVLSFQKNLAKVLGMKVSKAQAWSIFKLAIYTGCDLAKDGVNVSLAGICKFKFNLSKRSGNKRIKMTTSGKISRILEDGGHFFVEEEFTEETASSGSTATELKETTVPSKESDVSGHIDLL